MKDRVRIIGALIDMPEEAFAWFALAALSGSLLHGQRTQIWPDKIKRFGKRSQHSIKEIRAAATDYVRG